MVSMVYGNYSVNVNFLQKHQLLLLCVWFSCEQEQNDPFLTKTNIWHIFLDAEILLLLFCPSVVSDSLRLYGLQHVRLPCPLLSLRACSNSRPLSRWSHLTISSPVIPFSSCLQSFSASGSFPMSLLLISGAQSTGASASASVFLMNIQDWFPLGWTGLISFQCKGLSRVFSNTTVQKHQLFGTQPSSRSNSHIHTWLLEKPIALTIWNFVFSYMLNNNT